MQQSGSCVEAGVTPGYNTFCCASDRCCAGRSSGSLTRSGMAHCSAVSRHVWARVLLCSICLATLFSSGRCSLVHPGRDSGRLS